MLKIDRNSKDWKEAWRLLIDGPFPFPFISDESWERRVQKLIDAPSVFNSKPGNDLLCNIFYPQMWDHLVRLFNKIDKEKFLKNRIKHADRTTGSSLLTGLKLMARETRNNFCPNLAKGIYQYLTNGVPSKILDYSSGFGGRLMGCFLNNPNHIYHGIDPWKKNIDSSYKMLERLDKIIPNCSKRYFPYNKGSEDYIPYLKDSIDVAFSSPPYFSYEKYCFEINQCYIKYPRYEEWIDLYWKPTVENIKLYLKPEGIFALNVTNVGSYNLVKDMTKIIIDQGFVLKDTLNFKVTARMYKDRTAFKQEPVFIFKK